MSTLVTLGTTLASGVIAALIALGFDGWRGDRTRRREGRESLQEMQRVLSDLSGAMLARDGVIDVTPLENLDWADVAAARRGAYPYRDLLSPEDRELVSRNLIPYDVTTNRHYDQRQVVVNEWAMDLDAAIQRAFASPVRRRQLRRHGGNEAELD